MFTHFKNTFFRRWLGKLTGAALAVKSAGDQKEAQKRLASLKMTSVL